MAAGWAKVYSDQLDGYTRAAALLRESAKPQRIVTLFERCIADGAGRMNRYEAAVFVASMFAGLTGWDVLRLVDDADAALPDAI